MIQASKPLHKLPCLRATEAGWVLDCTCGHGTRVAAPTLFASTPYACSVCSATCVRKPDGLIIALMPEPKAQVQS